jgi:hypothetical protein
MSEFDLRRSGMKKRVLTLPEMFLIAGAARDAGLRRRTSIGGEIQEEAAQINRLDAAGRRRCEHDPAGDQGVGQAVN